MGQVETKIVTVLEGAGAVTALASTRIYPVILPQDPTLPAATYVRISGGQDNTLGGYTGMENPRIEINAWALSYATAKSLATAVRNAMDGATTFKALCISDMDLYEDDTKIYRVSLDFSVWNKET